MPRRQSISSCKLTILGLLLSFVKSKLTASTVLMQCKSKQLYLSYRKQLWLQTVILFPWNWPSKPSLILMEILTAQVILPLHFLCVFNLHKKSSEWYFYIMVFPTSTLFASEKCEARDALFNNHSKETKRQEYAVLLPPTFNEACLPRRMH